MSLIIAYVDFAHNSYLQILFLAVKLINTGKHIIAQTYMYSLA